MKILIPMAGLGKRFRDAGYSIPKPLITVGDRPMVQAVMENLNIDRAEFILIVQRDHYNEFSDAFQSIKASFNVEFELIDGLTRGTACTVLAARHHIDECGPLLIANSDQIVDFSLENFIDIAERDQSDGKILTFKSSDLSDKWSYAELGPEGYVCRVAEKEPISHHATCGLYFYRLGGEFVDAANEMIAQNETVNNEFYVCPTYNYLIKKGKKVTIFEVSETSMHGIGTPEDLNKYLDLQK